MKMKMVLTLAMAFSTACASRQSSDGSSAVPQDLTWGGKDALSDAYVWGYPLVVNQRTFQTLGTVLGVNRLFNQPALSTPATRFIVAPNHDALYSAAVLDLRSEPMVLTVPDVSDRYWVFQFIDAWTNTFFYAGTRTTSGKGGKFAITPPGWNGTLPDGVTAVASPTPQAFILGRYLVKSDADVAVVAAIPRTMEGLHTLTGTPAPAPPPPLGNAPGTPQQVGSNGAAFFDELGDALASNPPYSKGDERELHDVAAFGIGPGLHPAASASASSNQAALTALTNAVAEGNAAILAEASSVGVQRNGWNVELEVTAAPTDPLLRAGIVQFLWVPNVPEEAVYAVGRKDFIGRPLDGTTPNVMHFPAGQFPPVGPMGFWSVTMYGPDMFFVQNAPKRYSIGDRTPDLAFNPDGSLDIYIQSTTPVGHETNWLPAPSGPYVLATRVYLPGPTVLSGDYGPPQVVPVMGPVP
jgi:hypothetical protein